MSLFGVYALSAIKRMLFVDNNLYLPWTGKTDVDLLLVDLIRGDKANTVTPKSLFKHISSKVSHLLKDNLSDSK